MSTRAQREKDLRTRIQAKARAAERPEEEDPIAAADALLARLQAEQSRSPEEAVAEREGGIWGTIFDLPVRAALYYARKRRLGRQE